MAPAVGQPAQRRVPHHLAEEQERGEDAGLRGRRVPGPERVHRIEAAADRTDHAERPGGEIPR